MTSILLAIVEVHGALSAISTDAASYYTTHYQNVSAFDFSMHGCEQQTPYVDNPVIEKYFSRYDVGDFMSYSTMKDILDNPVMLAGLESTVGRIHTSLKRMLEGMPERVSERMQGSIVSRIKEAFRGVFGDSTEGRFDKLVVENVDSPREFFRRYTEFMIRYITEKIQGYGEVHGIPDELFERLALLSEFKTMSSICGEYMWDFTVEQIMSELNSVVLKSYRNFERMLERIETLSQNISHHKYQRFMEIHSSFLIQATVSLQDISDSIRRIKGDHPMETPHGKIMSDRIYDITYQLSKKKSAENIDMGSLENVIRDINDIHRNEDGTLDAVNGITPLGRSHTFKYSVNGKDYFLKHLDTNIEFSRYGNTNDILFGELDSPYILKTHKILYNRLDLVNGDYHDQYWILTEFLDTPPSSIDWKDMDIVRGFASDILNGLDYLQSNGIMHRDLFESNICGKKIQRNGKTSYEFKVVDLGIAFRFSDKYSLADLENDHWQINTGEDLYNLSGIIKRYAIPGEDEKPRFDDFVSKMREEVWMSSRHLPNIKKLLKHPFITGSPSIIEEANSR